MYESVKFFTLNGEKFYLYETILFKPRSVRSIMYNGMYSSTASISSNYATISYSPQYISSNTASIGYQTIKFVTSSGATTVPTGNEEYSKWTINFITEFDYSYEIAIKQDSNIHRIDVSKNLDNSNLNGSITYANDRIKKILNPNTILKGIL